MQIVTELGEEEDGLEMLISDVPRLEVSGINRDRTKVEDESFDG